MTGQASAIPAIQSSLITSNQTQSADKPDQKGKLNSHAATLDCAWSLPEDIILAIMTHLPIRAVLDLSSVQKQYRAMFHQKLPLLMSRKAKNIFNKFAASINVIKYQNQCEALKKWDLPSSRLGQGATVQSILAETNKHMITCLSIVNSDAFVDVDAKGLKFEDFPDALPVAKHVCQMKAYLGFFEQIPNDGELEIALRKSKECTPKQQETFNQCCTDLISHAFITQERFLKSSDTQDRKQSNPSTLSESTSKKIIRENSQSSVVNTLFDFIYYHCQQRNGVVVIELLQKLEKEVFSFRLQAEFKLENPREFKWMFLGESLARNKDIVKLFEHYIKNHIEQLSYSTQTFFRFVLNCYDTLYHSGEIHEILLSRNKKLDNIIQTPPKHDFDVVLLAMDHWHYFHASHCYTLFMNDTRITKENTLLLLSSHCGATSLMQSPVLKHELMSQFNDILFIEYDNTPEIIKLVMPLIWGSSERVLNCFFQCMRKEMRQLIKKKEHHRILLILTNIAEFLFLDSSREELGHLLQMLSQNREIAAFFQRLSDTPNGQLDPSTTKLVKMVLNNQ